MCNYEQDIAPTLKELREVIASVYAWTTDAIDGRVAHSHAISLIRNAINTLEQKVTS